LLVGIDVLFPLLFITFLFPKEVIINGYVPALLTVFLSIMITVALSKLNQPMTKQLIAALFISLCTGIYFFSASWLIMLCALLFLHWRISTYINNHDHAIEVSSGSILIFLSVAAFSLLTGSMRDLENTYI
ncbi:hypothetical protein R0J90_12595, partial [Micrococcus sp. SIMBA_144]